MTSVNAGGDFNIQEIFQYVADAIQNKGENLRSQMANIKTTDGKISDQDMLKLQYEVGTYNTLLETVSTVTKSLTDEAKQLAQRSA